MFFSADFRLPLCHALLSENEHTVSDVLISSGIPLSVYATILMTLAYDLSPLFVRSVMENIKLYEIDPASINYLGKFASHLFHNKAAGQVNERKYIGVVLV